MYTCPLITCISYYTFLEGIHSIPEIVNYGAKKNTGVLCLADKNGLYGAIEFYILCREANIVPLIGTELIQEGRHVTIIARNRKGYEELSELVTRYHLGNLRIHDDLSLDSPNLLYICCDHFLLQRWLLRNRSRLPDNLFLALTITNRQSFRSILNLLSHRSDLPKLPAVPIVELNLLHASEKLRYKVLRAIHHNCTVDTLPEEERLRNTRRVEKIPSGFVPYEPVVSGTDIAKLCQLEFDLERYHLPKFSPMK